MPELGILHRVLCPNRESRGNFMRLIQIENVVAFYIAAKIIALRIIFGHFLFFLQFFSGQNGI